MKNKKFFSRNIINTSKNGEPVRIQKREPVILLGYFFDLLKNNTSLDTCRISCEPDLRDWIKELLIKRGCHTVSLSRLRIWKKHLYYGKYKRLNKILKYLYSGTTLAILLLFYNKAFNLQDILDKFYKEDLLLLKRWFLEVYKIEAKVDLDNVTLSIQQDDLLELIEIALVDIKDISNPYVKNKINRIREELLHGKTKKANRKYK